MFRAFGSKAACQVLLGVSVFLLVTNWFLFSANQKLVASSEAAKIKIERMEEAADRADQQIDLLAGDLKQCVVERAVDEATNAEIVENLSLRVAGYEARIEFMEQSREEIYREPSCAELARLDLAAACPAIVDRVRTQAARHH